MNQKIIDVLEGTRPALSLLIDRFSSADQSGDYQQDDSETSNRECESVLKPALSTSGVHYEETREGETRADAEDAFGCHLAVVAKYPHITSE